MATDFDADVAAHQLTELVNVSRKALEDVVPRSAPGPIFRQLPSGEVVDRNGQLLRGPIAPPPAKGS